MSLHTYPTQHDLHSMPNSILIESTELLVQKERKLIEVLIWHLQEIQDRKLYISMGYSSLYECLVKHFKYSESVAYQRLSALKIIKAVPLASQSLKEGKVSLTTLSQVQNMIQKQEKDLGEKLPLEMKHSYLKSIENKTSQEVKQVLAEINPASVLPQDKVVYLTKEDIQLQITVDKKLLEKINEFKSLISHENINPNYNEILHKALDVLIETTKKKKGLCSKLLEPIQSAETTQSKDVLLIPEIGSQEINQEKITQSLLVRNTQSSLNQPPLTPSQGCLNLENRTHNFEELNTLKNKNLFKSDVGVQTNTKKAVHSHFNFKPSSRSHSRYISRYVKQQVLKRAKNRCEHLNHRGERCESQFQLQFDHIEPVSFGGSSDISNIQLLCRAHNVFKGNKVG